MLGSLVAGVLIGAWVHRDQVTLEDIKATVLEPPGTPGDFALTAHDQTPFTPESLQGTWSFVFFGYTHCPDVCPTTLHTLVQVNKAVAESSAIDDEIQVVFVSVDPARDTPARLAEYVPYFNPAFIGVTGKQAEINRFTRRLGILHVQVERDGDESYLVDHTSSILLFNPNGELRALFSMPHAVEAITEDFLKIARLRS